MAVSAGNTFSGDNYDMISFVSEQQILLGLDQNLNLLMRRGSRRVEGKERVSKPNSLENETKEITP